MIILDVYSLNLSEDNGVIYKRGGSELMENILVQKLKEYRMLYVFCMLVHIVLAVEFNRLQLYVLFGFNICSVIMYFMGTICMRRERHVKF